VTSFQIKAVIIGVLSVGVTIGTFWLWRKAMPGVIAGEFSNYVTFITPLCGLIVSAVLFTLIEYFFDPKISYSLALALAVVPYFFVPANVWALGAATISFGLLASAVYRVKTEYNFASGFSASRVSRASFPIFFTFTALVISIYYLADFHEEKAVSSLFPRSVFNIVLKAIPSSLQKEFGIPEIGSNQTVDDFLTILVKQEIQKAGLPESRISQKDIEEAVALQRKEISKQYHLQLHGNENMRDVLYNTMVDRMKDLLGPYQKYLPIASAVAFFLAFRVLGLPLYYLSFFLFALLIRLLIWLKLVKKELKQVEVERLTL